MDEKKIITVENLRQFKDLYDVEIADGLLAKENTANKVTTITGESTDGQYPSAKAVRTYVEDNTIDETVDNLVNYTLKTETGSSIDLSINSSTYVMTLNLKDVSGNIISTDSVDLPLESMVVNATYDSENKKIVLILQSGSTIDVPVADLVSGLVSTEDLETILADYQLKSNYWIELTGSVKAATLTSGIYINTTNSRISLYDDDNRNGFEIRPGGIFIIAPANNASYADYSIIYFAGKGGNFDTYSSASDRTTVFTVTVGFINTMTPMKHRVSSTYSFDLNPGLHGTTILKALQGFAANKTQMLVNTNGSISWTEGSLEDVKTQYSTMPTASADNLGKIVQYTGADTQDYTQGHFYIVVSDGESTPTYSWQEISFGGEDNPIKTITDEDILAMNTKYEVPSSNSLDLSLLYLEYGDGLYVINSENYSRVRLDSNMSVNYTLLDAMLLVTTKGRLNLFLDTNTEYGLYAFVLDSLGAVYARASYVRYNLTRTAYRTFFQNLFGQKYVTSLSNGGQVLTIYNETSYTPTSDYNPSTKKYTDDTALSTVVADKLTGTTAPTTSTVGYVGQQYTDTTNNNQYVCTAVDTATPEYTWVQVNGGGSGAEKLFINHNVYTNTLSADNLAVLQKVYDKFINNEPIDLEVVNYNGNYSDDFGKHVIFVCAKVSGTTFSVYCENPLYVNNGYGNKNYTIITATITNGVLSNGQCRSSLTTHKFPLIPTGTSISTSYPYALVTNNTIPYTPTSDYNPATKKYVDDAVGAVVGMSYEVVSSLPATGENGKIYLIANSGSGQNIYDEYIWISGNPTGSFEKIGTTDIDLNNYYTKTEADAEFTTSAEVNTLITNAITSENLVTDANYVHTDNNYTTAEKTKLAGVEAGAEVNVIETIKVNGTALVPDANKAVDIVINTANPTNADIDGLFA